MESQTLAHLEQDLDENPLLVPTLDQEEASPSSPTQSATSMVPSSCSSLDFSPFSFGETSKKPAMVGAGLANLGNTCFLNAVLQCFTHTVPFVEGLRSCDHLTPCRRASEGFCVICVIRDHVEGCLASSGRTIWPDKLVDNLSNLSSYFQRYQQEDAHEFLQCLLDRLETCSLDVSTKKENSSSQDDSFVKKIFGGRLRSQLQCGNCGHCSDTFDPFIDLSLEIKDVDTLPTALESFTKIEKLEETKFSCEKCKEEVLVEKQLMLEQAPSVAAFHLKRFNNDGSYVEKIDKHVDYPLELDLLPYTCNRESEDVDLKYDLYAIVVHVGLSLSSGHYFCFIRSSPDTWHRLDDSIVTRVSEEYVLSQEAYILFYAKKGTSWFLNLMETQKQCIDKFGAAISPKSVLVDVESTCATTYPLCTSNFNENDETRHDEQRLPPALPVGNCSTNVTGDEIDIAVVKNRNEVDVGKDRNEDDAMKDKSDNDFMKYRYDGDVRPRTPPYRSPSPEMLYPEEPPSPAMTFVIPRAHLKLKNQTPMSKHVNKALEDSKRKEAIRLTKSMPSSRGIKIMACMQGSQGENFMNGKKRKLGLSCDVGSDRKNKSSGACRKLNPSIIRSVKTIDFS